ncbi:maestro heat-like repeat-containing protein family member 2A isoform X12 [Homo sapiens]|uniref:maestro heat-like repeat-containing protein family member 2A isoform X12 n=1 Tax=Homo sapiens TaxID=9606 RepID=UPI0005D01D2C|nr:maestro heat-like repeat-containing protein family member 2A isoform X12 [Homo sapiens]|eukprot:XP_011509388.1 maestro heat-like repeat-containing protein family member 2A isoform X12 [Homo sapiens]
MCIGPRAELFLVVNICLIQKKTLRKELEEEMTEAITEAAVASSEEVSEERDDLGPLELHDSGTFQQVVNLLDIIDSESAKTDTTGAGLDMRKTLASVIIMEKATTEPSVVINTLIRCLQVPEISTQRKVNIYNILQDIIQQEGELEEQCVQRLVAIASKEMREIPEMEGYMKAEVASDTLVALSRNHFSLVMYELQHHLKPLNLTDEFVIITLAKLANGNVFEFMPYMGITLATIFTMLRLANEAKIRQAICSAMETFCETVQFYLKHLEESVYPVMTEEEFALKVFPMYRYFVTVWLRHYNPEVKLGVIKSLKPMLGLLLPNDDLREQVYDYIPLLLAEYQGSLEVLFVTQVLRQILELSVTTNTPVPQMQLHTIFTELHVQVCNKAPAQHQYSSQNLMEMVHCFVALARSYPKELMKFFFSQMETNKEAVRVGTLNLIRAIVSADEPRMSIRAIYLAIRVVKNTISDTRSKVRMAILHIIGQLALCGYQERIKGWGLKYLSVQLTLSTYKLTNRREKFYQRDLEERMVHKVTMDTVKIITSSVSGMTTEFWVRLLCYIMETDYVEALTPICISLTNLAEHQLHGQDVDVSVAGKSRQVDLPAPQKLLARLLVLMSSPYKGEGRGIAMLNLLRTLSQSIAPSMADMWELEIALLVRYLEEHTEFTWDQKAWEDKLIQFLRNSLKKTRGSSWSLRLSKELNNQIASFDSPSLEKGFLYRALGFTLATGLEASKVEVLLLELLYKTDYSNDFDSEGVIMCFGLCARGQVKTVLNVLHDFEERIQESEQSWQISAWRKDHPWRRETVKSALMVMYSCVASYCHPQLLLNLVDSPITAKIIHHYVSSCQVAPSAAWGDVFWTRLDICLKMAFMKSVVQVTKAINNIKDLEDFHFAQKTTLTSIIVAVIKAEPTDNLVSPVRALAMEALSHLSKLKPFYSTEENSELMDISIHSVISLQLPGEDNESIKTLYANALSSLEQLMESLLQRQLDPKGLQEMVQFMSGPVLYQEKLLKPAALLLEKGADQEEDEALRVLSLRALGNMALGAPKKVKQYRKVLLEKCLGPLREPVSNSVTAEGMEALTKILAELREGDVGSSFDAMSEQCRIFFDNESELLRLKAFILFGKLARVVGMSKKHFFKGEVKKAWIPLMLHSQDPCSNAAQACMATMFQCVHFWGWKSLEHPSGPSDTATDDKMTVFQTTMCSILTRKKPAVLYRFLLETMAYVKNNLSRIRIAACNLAGIIMKQMSTHYLKKLDFPALRNSLQELQLDPDPGVRRAALETLTVLDSCSQHGFLASPQGMS